MMQYVLYFLALMTVAVEIIIEKSGICMWKKRRLLILIRECNELKYFLSSNQDMHKVYFD